MSLCGNREGLRRGDGPFPSPQVQFMAAGRCVCMRCSSTKTKPESQPQNLAWPRPSPRWPPCCLALMEYFCGILWAMYPTESKPCRREKVASVHLEMLPTLSLSAGPLPTRGKMDQGCALHLGVSYKVPGHCVDN